MLEVREKMFYWRGRWFTGLVDPETNALFDNPDDSFMNYVRKNSVPRRQEKP